MTSLKCVLLSGFSVFLDLAGRILSKLIFSLVNKRCHQLLNVQFQGASFKPCQFKFISESQVIAFVVLTWEDFPVKYSQNNWCVCLLKMRFCCSFHKMLTVNIQLFLGVCRRAMSVLPTGIAEKGLGSWFLTCGGWWEHVWECFTSVLLGKNLWVFFFFGIFTDTTGKHRKKEVLFWEALTKAFQVPIQSCFCIAFYSFENPCGL